MKNKFRKITSVWVRICYMTWYPSLYRWPFCFQGPARHRAATATQYTGDVFDVRFVSESVNWTCFEHDFSLSSSFYYFWWFTYLQFGEIGLSRDQRHDKFVQCRQRESRLRTSRTSSASTTPKLASIIFYIGTPLSLLRINDLWLLLARKCTLTIAAEGCSSQFPQTLRGLHLWWSQMSSQYLYQNSGYGRG